MSDLIPSAGEQTIFTQEDMPADAPEWAKVLYRQNLEIQRVMVHTSGLIDAAAGEVSPILESLMKSPILKMMGVK